MNALHTATRVMRDGLVEMAALLVGERADDLRHEAAAAPGVLVPLPRRVALKRRVQRARKGIAPWQKVAAGRR